MTPEQVAWLVRLLIGALATVPVRIAEARADGIEEGVRIGAERAESDIAESWARVAAIVQESASPRAQAFADRRRAELEAAKPRPGDFTGRLSPAEYFGTDAAHHHSLKGRPAA